MENPEFNDGRLRTFGRRSSHKLRLRPQALVDELLPKLRIDVEAFAELGHGDPKALFAETAKEIWFEIGFGGGEHAAWQGEHHPDVGLIACEPFLNGVASLLCHIDDRQLTNIRILDDDARPLLDALGEATLSRVFLLFPDPWPKKRHHKRRFINQDHLDLLARVMKDGAEFRFGSDHMDYVSWGLEHICAHPDFEWICNGPEDWRTRPDDWPQTRYEAKAIEQGKKCAYLRFRRKAR